MNQTRGMWGCKAIHKNQDAIFQRYASNNLSTEKHIQKKEWS